MFVPEVFKLLFPVSPLRDKLRELKQHKGRSIALIAVINSCFMSLRTQISLFTPSKLRCLNSFTTFDL